MSNNVHSRQPFDNRNEEAPRSNSRLQRDRNRDDRDYREQPPKRFDENGKRDRRREPDDRRDYRDRREEENLRKEESLRSPKNRRRPEDGLGLALKSPQEDVDVMREDQSIHSSMQGSTRKRQPRSQSPESKGSPREQVASNGVDNAPRGPRRETTGEFDMSKWIKLAELGELDVYTCLGLSDACTWTVDTQSLVLKIITALLLQCLIPVCMLYLQLGNTDVYDSTVIENVEIAANWTNFSDGVAMLTDHLTPTKSGIAYRFIGFVMFLYALYAMYNAASDECRSCLLHFCLRERVSCAIWWPLLLGEIANLLVGIVLTCTLYFMFVQTADGAFLVLNAVAVNFLADVDHQFVDREIYIVAIFNFKELMHKHQGKDSTRRACWARSLEAVLSLMMMLFIVLGIVLAFAFLLAPCRNGEPWYVSTWD